ncbi:hypothetical protein [Frondihabitans sp. PhB188]|uniref:hypothetical protein n=1 Tax=Frondihabitans sp. PhB188 TaxID=2485200 RepID=UPI000F465DA6|nr:hypothetical protein [Frondihabitans sp. PhB188]
MAATKKTLVSLIRRGPLSPKDMNDALRLVLPGVSCDVFADALTQLLRERQITISNGTYRTPDVMSDAS